MKIFIGLSAVLAWTFGAALLFATVSFLAPMGIDVTPAIAVSGQTQGAILIGLGVINWMARDLSGQSVKAVLAGNLAVQLLSLLVIVRALVLHVIPAQNAGAGAVHTVLGTGFLYFLWREGGRTTGAKTRTGSR
jgi:hypothetical protein